MNILDLAILKKLGGCGGGTGSADIDVTAEVGQTIIVKEVDTNGKPTKWESADYQSRTHWAEVGELLPNTTATFLEEDGVFVVMDCAFEFAIGKSYTVNWNGTPYTCVGVNVDGGVVVGNVALISGTGDTGEPFFIGITDGVLLCVPFDGSTEITIGVSGETIKKIDKKYLPEDIVYGNPDYSKSVFDIEGYCWLKGDFSGITNITDGFVNTPLTKAHFEVLEEVFTKQIVWFASGGHFVKASKNGDRWELQMLEFSYSFDALSVRKKKVCFQWSNADDCVQCSCEAEFSNVIQLKS